jgi:hypothetical protein
MVSCRWGVGSRGEVPLLRHHVADGLDVEYSVCGRRDERRNTQPSLGHQSKRFIMHAQNGSSVGTQRAVALGLGETLKRLSVCQLSTKGRSDILARPLAADRLRVNKRPSTWTASMSDSFNLSSTASSDRQLRNRNYNALLYSCAVYREMYTSQAMATAVDEARVSMLPFPK